MFHNLLFFLCVNLHVCTMPMENIIKKLNCKCMIQAKQSTLKSLIDFKWRYISMPFIGNQQGKCLILAGFPPENVQLILDLPLTADEWTKFRNNMHCGKMHCRHFQVFRFFECKLLRKDGTFSSFFMFNITPGPKLSKINNQGLQPINWVLLEEDNRLFYQAKQSLNKCFTFAI